MSRLLSEDDPTDLEVGDTIEFDSPKNADKPRMQGAITRVLQARMLYYVKAEDGCRYEVSHYDKPKLIKRKSEWSPANA